MKLVVKISQEFDGKVRGWCPALPGCCAIGQSEHQVLEDLQQLAQMYAYSFDASMPDSSLELVPTGEPALVS